MRAQIAPMTFAGFLADGSKVIRGSQKYTYWQELALARGTIAMAANQSITVNVGALSNAIAVAIQQATTDSEARGSASGGAVAVPVAPSSSIGICCSLLNCNSNGIRQSAHIDGEGLVGCHCTGDRSLC